MSLAHMQMRLDGQKANPGQSFPRCSYLPAAARFSVVGEIITDPLVDLAQGHFLLWRAVNGESDEAGVAIWRLAVFVLLHLFLVQRSVVVQQSALFSHARAVSALGIGLLDGCSHGQLRQPVHRGQTALQLRRHGWWSKWRSGRKFGGKCTSSFGLEPKPLGRSQVESEEKHKVGERSY